MSFTGISKTNYIVSQGSYGTPQNIRDKFLERLLVKNALLLQSKILELSFDSLSNTGGLKNLSATEISALQQLRNQVRDKVQQETQNNNLSDGTEGGTGTATTASTTGNVTATESIGPQVVFNPESIQQTADSSSLTGGQQATTTSLSEQDRINAELISQLQDETISDILESNTFTQDKIGKDINLEDDYEQLLNQIDVDVLNIKTWKDLASIFLKVGGSNVSDPIRALKGNYFVIQNNTVQRLITGDLFTNLINIKKINAVPSLPNDPPPKPSALEVSRNYYYLSTNVMYYASIAKTYFPLLKDNVDILASFSSNFRDALIELLVDKTTKIPTRYEEYAFSYQTPLDYDVVQKTNFGNCLFYDVKTEYNFYSELYEKTIEPSNISETLLPNLYFVKDPSITENKDGFPLQHVTLNKNIGVNYGQFYFDNWAKTVNKISNISELDTLKLEASNIGIQKKDFKALSDLSGDREDFPMYAKINFSTTNIDEKYSFIDKKNGDQNSYHTIRDNTATFSALSKPNLIDTLTTIDFNELYDTPTVIEQGIAIKTNNNITTIESIFSSSIKPLICYRTKDGVRIEQEYNTEVEYEYFVKPKGRGNKEFSVLSEKDSYVQPTRSSIVERILFNKSEQERNNYFSNRGINYFNPPENVQNSETFAYRITKYRVFFVNGQKNRQFVQSYYVPNFSDVTNFTMYDTQLKYGIRYEYDVTALQLFFSNNYSFYPLNQQYFSINLTPYLTGIVPNRYPRFSVTQKPLNTAVATDYIAIDSNSNGIQANETGRIITVYDKYHVFFSDKESEPKLKLIETPYFSKEVIVRDSPPIQPDVSVVFFKDISNVVKFMFNSQTGLKYEEPIAVEPSDKQQFDRIKEAQERKDQNTIKFESEDPPSYFEVYKLTTKPTSYRDFEGARIYQVLPKFGSFAGDVVDLVIPNTKNYYMFRVVDIHSQVSNPTSCFEIEIVNDNGKVYPILNIIELKPKAEEENKTKKLKRFLHIKPSANQKEIRYQNNNDSSALTNKIDIGANDSVWGRKFKIRVKSKLSNKVIDLNVTFDKQHILSKDEKDLTS